MIRLRPHHLLCSLTFIGEGYSDTFVANFRTVLKRIEAGEPITIVSGPDAICAPLLDSSDAHCHSDEIIARDDATCTSLAVDEALRSLLDGGTIGSARIVALRDAFARGTIRAACAGCSWFALCTDVANGYAKAVLRAD